MIETAFLVYSYPLRKFDKEIFVILPEMSKKDTRLNLDRDRELYDIYTFGLENFRFSSLREAADWARNQPASRFFISSKSLVKYFSALASHTPMPAMYPENRRKVQFLYRRYLEWIKDNPEMASLPRYSICELLVDSPAPCFFMGIDSAVKVILRERNRSRMRLIEYAQR